MSLLSVIMGIMGLVLVFTVLELLGDTSSKPNVTFFMVLQLALLKLPHMLHDIFPFAVLIAGMIVFWRLSRSHELVILRSVGVSIWQFLLPIVVASFLVGLVNIMLLNPVVSLIRTHRKARGNQKHHTQ